MSKNADRHQKELVRLLIQFAGEVGTLNDQGKTDLAKSAELLYKDLLPLIFKQTFSSPTNVINDTFDLAGEAVGKKRVIVQVTSRSDAAKIKDTLTNLSGKWPGTKPSQLHFILIGQRPNYQKKTFEDCPKDFKYSEQIIGISQLVARISSEGLSAIERAHEIAERHLNLQGPNSKVDNERLLESIRLLQKELFESKAKISEEIARQVNNHDAPIYKLALEKFQGLLKKWSEWISEIHEVVNAEIDKPQDALREQVASVANHHVIQMGHFLVISQSEARAREVGLLIKAIEDSRSVIANAQEDLKKLELEQDEIAKKLNSLRFHLLLTNPDSPLLKMFPDT